MGKVSNSWKILGCGTVWRRVVSQAEELTNVSLQASEDAQLSMYEVLSFLYGSFDRVGKAS